MLDAQLMMLEMMFNKTENAAEMRKLANIFMDNPNIQKFIMTPPVSNTEIQGFLLSQAKIISISIKPVKPRKQMRKAKSKNI